MPALLPAWRATVPVTSARVSFTVLLLAVVASPTPLPLALAVTASAGSALPYILLAAVAVSVIGRLLMVRLAPV